MNLRVWDFAAFLNGGGAKEDKALDPFGSGIIDECLYGIKRIRRWRADEVDGCDGVFLGFRRGEGEGVCRLVGPLEAHGGVGVGFAAAGGNQDGAILAMEEGGKT